MIKYLCVRWFKRKGWRFVGTVPRKEKGVVIVVGPQTSWHDLIIAIAVKTITHFNVDVLVDSAAWTWKSKWLLKAAGAVKWYNEEAQRDRLMQRLSSGSRYAAAFMFNPLNTTTEFGCSEFYTVALRSKTSVVLVALDHRRRIVKFHNPFYLSGIVRRDMSYIGSFYQSFYWFVNSDRI